MSGESPSILDLGCGTGILREYFNTDKMGRYFGLDVSAAAIAVARARAFEKSVFEVGDLESWRPEGGSFDAAVLNEVLGYFLHPEAALSATLNWVRPGGLVCVSHYRTGLRSRQMWRRLERVQRCAHTIALTNERGQRWDIKFFVKP